MVQEPGREAVFLRTGFGISLQQDDQCGEVAIRTLSARIHSAFSSVLNALHSFRNSGFVQEFLGRGTEAEDTSAEEQRMARATEKTLWRNILGEKLRK
jgi:hypothetical protein